jgi:hypothetical protein
VRFFSCFFFFLSPPICDFDFRLPSKFIADVCASFQQTVRNAQFPLLSSLSTFFFRCRLSPILGIEYWKQLLIVNRSSIFHQFATWYCVEVLRVTWAFNDICNNFFKIILTKANSVRLPIHGSLWFLQGPIAVIMLQWSPGQYVLSFFSLFSFHRHSQFRSAFGL